MRKIIHIDMDAFYASIEQRDNAQYRGKPIAVGGSPEGRGGVVATCSYEARKFGVRSAMSSKKAKQLCPNLIFVRPRFAVYKQVSERIREIFLRYTDLIEPLSLDEAFLDVTGSAGLFGPAPEIGRRIKQDIKQELRLVASVGVAPNKFLAKIASDLNKPDGFLVGFKGVVVLLQLRKFESQFVVYINVDRINSYRLLIFTYCFFASFSFGVFVLFAFVLFDQSISISFIYICIIRIAFFIR